MRCGQFPERVLIIPVVVPYDYLPAVVAVPGRKIGRGIGEVLDAAGLQVDKVVSDWPGDSYCVLFVKK